MGKIIKMEIIRSYQINLEEFVRMNVMCGQPISGIHGILHIHYREEESSVGRNQIQNTLDMMSIWEIIRSMKSTYQGLIMLLDAIVLVAGKLNVTLRLILLDDENLILREKKTN